MSTTLAELVQTSNAVRATRARLEKRAHLRALLERLEGETLRLAASYLSGEIPQGRVQVGWSVLQKALQAADTGDDMPLFATVAEAAPSRSPTLEELDATFAKLHALAGPGSAQRRVGVLRVLLEPLDEAQRAFVQGLFLGELRQGALRAIAQEALAERFAVEIDALRRAVMFAGSLGEVVRALDAVRGDDAEATCLQRGEVLLGFEPRHGVPIEPMLAANADDVETALASFGGRAAVEWKLDGVRVQVHRHEDDVRVFSRRLRDVTALVPETVEAALGLSDHNFILDGEVIGFDARGRPAPFQDFMSRFSREADPDPDRDEEPTSPNEAARDPDAAADDARARDGDAVPIVRVETWYFDVLQRDGRSCVDDPYFERRTALEALVPETQRVPQEAVDDVKSAARIFDAARAAGHEGIVVKQLEAPYTAGRRGSAWCKVKPAETLDLVILAAEWGHGRRQGFLSNLHLGARDDDGPERFYMLGKTFKGLTDVMLQEMTDDLLELATRRDEHVVHVRPERVVEIAFDAVQRSRRYDSGFALRFARVKRFRPDKAPGDANTLADVQRVFERQRGPVE